MQLLAVACGIIEMPKLLMVDEPSLGLAAKAKETVYQYLTEIRQGGVSILLVEQDVSLAYRNCDRCYVMFKGKIVEQGDKQTLSQIDIEKE